MTKLQQQDRRIIQSALRSAAEREAHNRTHRSHFFADDNTASERRERAIRQTLRRVSP